MRSGFHILHRTLLILWVIASALGMTFFFALQGSLPQREGVVIVSNLDQKIDIRRDSAGLPSIESTNRESVLFGLGFVHAQDQFVTMDLLRRTSVGRLSELLGARAHHADVQRLHYRLETLTEQLWARATPAEQALLTAYSHGVNAGLDQQTQAPLFYSIRHQQPEPWQPQDALRVLLSYLILPHEPYLLLPLSSEVVQREADSLPWLAGTSDPTAYSAVTEAQPLQLGIPQTLVRTIAPHEASDGYQLTVQKNSHLPLIQPWYQVRWRTFVQGPWTQGLSLPGLPTLLLGRNDAFAWSMLPSDQVPFQWLRLDVQDEQYWHPELGWTHFHYQRSPLSESSLQRHTTWGPVMGADDQGQWLVLSWPGFNAQDLSLDWLHIDQHTQIEDLLTRTQALPGTEWMVIHHEGSWAIQYDWTTAPTVLTVQDSEQSVNLSSGLQRAVLRGQRLTGPLAIATPATLLHTSHLALVEQPLFLAWQQALIEQLEHQPGSEFSLLRNRLGEMETFSSAQRHWHIELVAAFRQHVLTQFLAPEFRELKQLSPLFRAPYHMHDSDDQALSALQNTSLETDFWQQSDLFNLLERAQTVGQWPQPNRTSHWSQNLQYMLDATATPALWLPPLVHSELWLEPQNLWRPELELSLVLNASASDQIAGERRQSWHPLQPYTALAAEPQRLAPGSTRYQLTLLPGR